MNVSGYSIKPHDASLHPHSIPLLSGLDMSLSTYPIVYTGWGPPVVLVALKPHPNITICAPCTMVFMVFMIIMVINMVIMVVMIIMVIMVILVIVVVMVFTVILVNNQLS